MTLTDVSTTRAEVINNQRQDNDSAQVIETSVNAIMNSPSQDFILYSNIFIPPSTPDPSFSFLSQPLLLPCCFSLIFFSPNKLGRIQDFL